MVAASDGGEYDVFIGLKSETGMYVQMVYGWAGPLGTCGRWRRPARIAWIRRPASDLHLDTPAGILPTVPRRAGHATRRRRVQSAWYVLLLYLVVCELTCGGDVLTLTYDNVLYGLATFGHPSRCRSQSRDGPLRKLPQNALTRAHTKLFRAQRAKGF